MNGHGPFLFSFGDCQVNNLDGRAFTWEYLSVSNDLANHAVDAFDGVGRVDRLANFRRILEHRRDVWPVTIPGL